MKYFRIKTAFLLICLFIVFILLSVCSPKETKSKELETVKVQLGWIHHSQWAEFYAADKNGYYSEEGINIELIPRPSPAANVFDIIENKGADFGISNGIGLVTERSENQKIKAIAIIYQRDPGVFMSLEESGIIKLEDFPGKRIKQLEPVSNGMILRAMMNKVGLIIDSMIQIKTGFDLSKLYNGEVDIWYGFLTNEVQVARSAGYAVNVNHPNGYGVNIYGNAKFATDNFINDNPDLYRTQELRNFEASIPLINTGGIPIGVMKGDKWQETIDLLIEQNLQENNIKTEDVYTTEFMVKLLKDEL